MLYQGQYIGENNFHRKFLSGWLASFHPSTFIPKKPFLFNIHLEQIRIYEICISLYKIAFLAFFENCKIENWFLSNFFPISNNLLGKLLHKTIGEKLLKNSKFIFVVLKKG